MSSPKPATIHSFLAVNDAAKATAFYVKAFGATLVKSYKRDDGGMNSHLTIDDAVFWIGDEEPQNENLSPATVGGTPVRLIIVTENPEPFFEMAEEAGATIICPLTTEEAWRIGKLKDPFGHIWEIGHPLP